MNHLVIDAGGLVVNVIVAAGPQDCAVPAGHTIEPQQAPVWIGWRRDGGQWLPPAPQEVPDETP